MSYAAWTTHLRRKGIRHDCTVAVARHAIKRLGQQGWLKSVSKRPLHLRASLARLRDLSAAHGGEGLAG
jgi:hypothetical protein